MKFNFEINKKRLIFDSELKGLSVNGRQFNATEDGVLIYDKTQGIKSDTVNVQMSSNTSTLIPALRILSVPYNKYFDQRDVIESQNNIAFYWNKSRLAAYYNRYSTDDLPYEKRERVIRKAVNFMINNSKKLALKDEELSKVSEQCKLLGFYEGFPIFDGNFGIAKLLSRLGIHIGNENVMISSPLDKYSEDVYELAENISKKIGEQYTRKKNRVIFEKSEKLLQLLKLLE